MENKLHSKARGSSHFQIIFLFQFFFFISLAQGPQGSSTLVQTCQNNTNCYHTKTPSYIYYEESKGELIVKTDLAKAGQDDSLGKWVQGIMNFQFTAPLDKSQFPHPANYNANHVTADGIVTINGISHHQMVDITIYQIDNSVSSNRANNNSIYDAYRVNLAIPVSPSDYDLGSDLKGTVHVSINSGVINELIPAGNVKPD
jgi:hypothetical protein